MLKCDYAPGDQRRRGNHLNGFAREKSKGGPKSLMPLTDCVETVAQHRGIDCFLQTDDQRQIVERCSRKQLIEKPKPALGR